MKIVALEEHLVTQSLMEAWRSGPSEAEDHAAARSSQGLPGQRLFDLGEGRLAAMDDQGVDVQVLSITQPGVQNLRAEIAVPLAREANDLIATTVGAHPDRFQGFATLPTPDPEAAVAELYRGVRELGMVGAMVFGRTGDKNADHPDFEPLWAAASALKAPVYIHPQAPQRAVEEVYYRGLSPQLDSILGTGLIGWHYETGMQLLRMILGGVFDRHPDLQVVVGHWGEVVLFWETRFAMLERAGLVPTSKPIIDYFREHVSFTGSGDTSARSLAWTKELVGAERILFATDYPYIDNGGGRARSFLTDADLTEQEKEAIGHGNWERLTCHLR